MGYLKRPSFSPYVPWRLLGILFACDLIVMIVSLARPALFGTFEHPRFGFYLAMAISIIGPTISGILCVKGSLQYLWRSPTRQTRRFSPLLWGLSEFVYAFGQIIWLGLILIFHRVPHYPSITHFIDFATYICSILAVLLLPARRITSLMRLRVLLDSLIIMAAVTTLCYYFVLFPVLVGGHGSLLAKTVSGIYPTLDLLVLFCVLVVALRADERILHPVLLMVGLAAALQFVVNVFHLHETLNGHYNEFSTVETVMVFYGALLVGASQTVRNIVQRGETIEVPVTTQNDQICGTSSFWKVVSPAALVLVFGVLTFVVWLLDVQIFPRQMVIVYIGGFVVLVLMVLRQFLVMDQIGVLQGKLQKKNSTLDVLNAQLAKQATTDPLTDLSNHRALAETLDGLLAQADKTGTPCSVVFMDIDHFKAINDCYGHQVGDFALSYFAQIVRSTIREGDALGRWGGEEFVAILPHTGAEKAFELAERIRLAVSCRAPGCKDALRLTCSLGVATYPQDATEREDLLRNADQAMYTAKRLGRNQTRVACDTLALAGSQIFPLTESEETNNVSEIAESLLALVKVRDVALSQHARRVADLSRRLAQKLGLDPDETRIVSLAGLLHDLGNITMPDTFLCNHAQPDWGELEYQAHYPLVGAAILAPVPALGAVAALVRAQREWLDGSGSPDGLKGTEIPLGARIIAVASAYDALLHGRAARSGRTPTTVLRELRRASGTRFDPHIVETLARMHPVSPGLFRADVAYRD